MLLLEESAQQLSLQQQLQRLSEATATTSGTQSEGEQDVQITDQSKDTKVKAIEAALEMRSQYALLLQQQVQDLVQSVDTNGPLTNSTRSNNRIYLRSRAEHIAVLNLACHLVAFSIETEHGNGEGMSEGNLDLLRRRVDILAQAVDQLIPGPGSRVTHFEDLLSLDAAATEEHVNPTSALEDGRIHHPEGVAKDVADRARLIEAFFLVPLSKVLASSLDAALDNSSRSIPRTISLTNQFDSPIFKTEAYLGAVKQKIVAQYGVRTKSHEPDDNDYEALMDGHTIKLESMDHIIIHDWLVQVGFNTLAVTR